MRLKKRFPGVFLILLLAILHGCAQKQKKDVVTIRFANAESGAEQLELMREITGAFENENPQIYVKMETGIRSQKILTQIAGGDPPDVFMWGGGVVELKARGALLPLTPYVKKYQVNLSDYFTNIVEYFTYDDMLYAFPLQINTDCMVYNKDLFDEARLSYPAESWTWEDYYSAAQELTKDIDGDGRREQIGTLGAPVISWIVLNGGNIIDMEKQVCVVNSKEVIEALDFIRRMKDVSPSEAEWENLARLGSQVGTQGFASGRIAMMIAPAYMLSSLRQIKGFDWDVVPIPKPHGGSARTLLFSAAGLCISRQSKYPDESFKFIKFYCGRQAMMTFGKYKNGIPALKEAAYSSFLTPPPGNIRCYVEAVETATQPEVPKFKGWAEIIQIFSIHYELFALGQKSSQETVEGIEREINRYLSRNNAGKGVPSRGN